MLGLSTGFDAATAFFVACAGFGGGADLTGAGFAAVLTGLATGLLAAAFGGGFFAGTTARFGFAAAFTATFFAFAATGLPFAGTFAFFAFPVGAGLLFAIACVQPRDSAAACYSPSPTPRQPPKPRADRLPYTFGRDRPDDAARVRRHTSARCNAAESVGVSRFVILMLECYKRWLSPLLGSRCRFHPSCSDFARVAVARFGTARGGWLGLCRILRCQPLCTGGLDPCPSSSHGGRAAPKKKKEPMTDWLITNAEIVNEGRRETGDVSIRNGRIEKIGKALTAPSSAKVLDAKGRWLLPGMSTIRSTSASRASRKKPTSRANRARASRAASRATWRCRTRGRRQTDHAALEWKYTRASEVSRVNYAFYFGATNDNLAAIRTLDKLATPGIKVFMGASTGNMLVDDPAVLDSIFAETPVPIITHCEDTPTILANEAKARERWGDDIPADQHPLIRSREACVMSTKLAISLAKKHGTRLHVLHISTADECALFEPGPVEGKRITAETCGAFPAFHRRRLRAPRPSDQVQSPRSRPRPTATASRARSPNAASTCSRPITLPHLRSEKARPYVYAPSGLPLVQYALQCAIERVLDGKLTLERVVEAVSHAPVTLFNVRERGFIREGYFADLVLVDPAKPHPVTAADVLSKCGWSPFEGFTFRTSIAATFVNGHLAWQDGRLDDSVRGKRLEFAR